MLCGELLNGGFASAGAVPVVPCGLIGLWLPGYLRTTSPGLLTSPYLPLLAELLASDNLEKLRHQYQLSQMDVMQSNNILSSSDLDAGLDQELDEDVLLGNYNYFN